VVKDDVREFNFSEMEIFRLGIKKEKPVEPDKTEPSVKTNRKRGKLSRTKLLNK
jgi:hypothetical protein